MGQKGQRRSERPYSPNATPHCPTDRQRQGWLTKLERLITDLRRDNVPPGRISVLLLETITWSIVSGFKGLENDVVILAALTDIETDWHRGVAYVGMSRAHTRLHVIGTQ